MQGLRVRVRSFDLMTEEEKLNLARRVLDDAIREYVGTDEADHVDFLSYVVVQADAMADEIEESAGMMLAA